MHLLRQIFYVSRAREGLGDVEVRDILSASRRNNRRRDVTGSLMFSGAHFAQTLEGRPADLAGLLEHIALDPRHNDVRVVVDRGTTTRAFPEWSMAYVYRLDLADELDRLIGGAAIAPGDEENLVRRFAPDSMIGEL